jgi:hypothetical protein
VVVRNDYALRRNVRGTRQPDFAGGRLPTDDADRDQLTAVETVVALPMALAGPAVRRNLVRMLTLGAAIGGEEESMKFENTGVVNS